MVRNKMNVICALTIRLFFWWRATPPLLQATVSVVVECTIDAVAVVVGWTVRNQEDLACQKSRALSRSINTFLVVWKNCLNR
jgi:hypothetical protein